MTITIYLARIHRSCSVNNGEGGRQISNYDLETATRAYNSAEAYDSGSETPMDCNDMTIVQREEK